MRLPLASPLFAVLVLTGLVRPAPAELFSPETFTLSNGMQAVVIPNHRVPVVSHMVWYRVGAADEPAGKSGIAHLLEHLMFRGTEAVPPGEFSKTVARHGGRDNAFTSNDYTGYFQNVAKKNLELVMRMEADRMANLVLDPESVRTERDVVLEERSSRTDNDPGALLGERVQAVLFLNHPYREPVIGWKSEIAALEVEDAQAFYEKWYNPANAVLVVAGDVTAAELKPLAEKYYGAIAGRPAPPRLRLEEPPPVAARRVVLEDERVQQPSWRRRHLAPSYRTGEPEAAYALEVLAEVIGGGTTSRLYQSLVVDQRLAVSAGAYYSPSALDLTTFTIYASPRPGVTMDELEAAMEKELRDIATGNVDAGEVERAKTRLRANAVYARDSLQRGAYVFGEALTTGQTVEDVEAWPERIGAVTGEGVAEAARRVLNIEASVTGVLLPKERKVVQGETK